MAGGGLLQLVATGAQDVYLIGNPQITFFKVQFQRHTNFARECIDQTITGQPDFGQKITVVLSRSGDLVGPMHVEITLPSLPVSISQTTASFNVFNSKSGATSTVSAAAGDFNWCWVNYIGYRMLQSVTVEIGGQPIDKHYSMWYYLWFELSTTAAKRSGLQKMVGGYDHDSIPLALTANAVTPRTYFIPLCFWFNNHPGLALPLIALQYHEVRLVIEIAPLKDCVVLISDLQDNDNLSSIQSVEWALYPDIALAKPEAPKIEVWADYYYLDSDERKRFAQNQHEYLIKQVQFENPTIGNVTQGSAQRVDYKTFNHPITFHVWGFHNTTVGASADWTNFTNSPPFLQMLGGNIVADHKLTLNGNDRYTSKSADYYNLVQPYNHFTAIPPTGILTYSYALQPVEHQPSGSLNFSRIDNASNRFTVVSDMTTISSVLGSDGTSAWAPSGTNFQAHVFAQNYNVLRVMSGMGGLAYSN
jgi:hypothetical protein